MVVFWLSTGRIQTHEEEKEQEEQVGVVMPSMCLNDENKKDGQCKFIIAREEEKIK